MNPYQVTRDFEQALQEYTGAPFAIALNSCTAALMLACEWYLLKRGGECNARNHPSEYDYTRHGFVIPKHTYVSVPQAIIRAGGYVIFDDSEWHGSYQIGPLTGIWDCARRFTSWMYIAGQFQCVSFAASKILAAEQGGAILHDNAEADAWFRRMRFDARTEGIDSLTDPIKEIGHHCIMTPSVAAGLLVRLHHLPRHNADMPDYPYPDLSQMPVFR